VALRKSQRVANHVKLNLQVTVKDSYNCGSLHIAEGEGVRVNGTTNQLYYS
jgi:hypothetical protein